MPRRGGAQVETCPGRPEVGQVRSDGRRHRDPSPSGIALQPETLDFLDRLDRRVKGRLGTCACLRSVDYFHMLARELGMPGVVSPLGLQARSGQRRVKWLPRVSPPLGSRLYGSGPRRPGSLSFLPQA